MSDAHAAPAAGGAPAGDGHGHAHGGGHHTNYVKIWAILCGLLVVSVVGPMFEIQVLTLITAFGIAFVKAYLVITRFMHLPIERKFVPYMLGSMLALMALMVGAMSPDVLKHEGARWSNDAAKVSVERGMKAGATHHGGTDHKAAEPAPHGAKPAEAPAH